MVIHISLAVRDWDYMTPLLLGDVRSDKVHLKIERVNAIITNLATDQFYDAAETSFSRYVQQRISNDERTVGISNFLMRGFRHRCVITRTDGPQRLADLKNKKIGITGWQDSGSIWTRAVLRHEGIDIRDAYWFVGRLADVDSVGSRFDNFVPNDRVQAVPDNKSIMHLLDIGFLDAICTPFMPLDFFRENGKYRQLDLNFHNLEKAYFKAKQYVPGIHIISIKEEMIAKYKWLPNELNRMIDTSRKVWIEKRRKYIDTTPYLVPDSFYLSDNYFKSGLVENKKMVNDFVSEMNIQNIISKHISETDLFPFCMD